MRGCRAITEEEFLALLDATRFTRYGRRNRMLFSLMYYTGFRISEVLSLLFHEIFDYDTFSPRSIISVRKCNTKGKTNGRNITIPKSFQKEIRDYILINKDKDADSPVIFSSRGDGKALSPRGASWALSLALKSIGIDTHGLSTHCFRKKLANDVYESTGHDIIAVKNVLGHANIATSCCYIQSCDEKINKITSERDINSSFRAKRALRSKRALRNHESSLSPHEVQSQDPFPLLEDNPKPHSVLHDQVC